MAVASMVRVPDKLDEIIQANNTGQLWSMSAKELLLACTQLKARSALEIQAAVRGQYQVALMLRRKRFIDDLRALGREVFPRDFVIRGLGGMVRSPKPAPRGTQGVTVGDYSFGGLDFRYRSAQGGPTEEQADQPNDGGFSNNAVEQVEPLSSSPLSEGDVVECMETDEENPGALESPGVKLDVSTGGEELGGVHIPEGTLVAPILMEGPTAPDSMEVQSTELLSKPDPAVPKLMDIRLPAWVGERNNDPIPPSKYRCFSRCPVPDCRKQSNLRRHVMEAHLPFRFRLEGLMDMNWHSRMICSLEKLAELVLGTRSLDYLMEWTNKAGYIPREPYWGNRTVVGCEL